jgi:hypothetical protein
MTSDNDLRRAAHINAKKLVPSDRAALRVKVARALCSADAKKHGTVESVWKIYLPDADAAIAVALEEAAKVADEFAEADRKLIATAEDDEELAAFQRGRFKAKNIAAAIRAMKGNATSPESGAPDADQFPATR